MNFSHDLNIEILFLLFSYRQGTDLLMYKSKLEEADLQLKTFKRYIYLIVQLIQSLFLHQGYCDGSILL